MSTHHLPTPHRALTTEESRLALILLRRSVQDQIEKDLDRIDHCLRFLDLLDGDPDLEPDADGEDGHDAEGHTDDNGIADASGRDEQVERHDRLEAKAERRFAVAIADRGRRGLTLIAGGRA